MPSYATLDMDMAVNVHRRMNVMNRYGRKWTAEEKQKSQNTGSNTLIKRQGDTFPTDTLMMPTYLKALIVVYQIGFSKKSEQYDGALRLFSMQSQHTPRMKRRHR